MLALILRALMGTALIAGAGAGLLFGGYALSRLLLPHWPQDYHATAAIALMALVLIGYAGWAAMREPTRKKLLDDTAPRPSDCPSQV